MSADQLEMCVKVLQKTLKHHNAAVQKGIDVMQTILDERTIKVEDKKREEPPEEVTNDKPTKKSKASKKSEEASKKPEEASKRSKKVEEEDPDFVCPGRIWEEPAGACPGGDGAHIKMGMLHNGKRTQICKNCKRAHLNQKKREKTQKKKQEAKE